ncbi:C40 family peptidase [Pseudomonas sp. N040]|uniref:C40 family peptidase n=1 Tax=Pseudomonas sp. N040 TaxID=2785325 RepID=UPI0018A2D87C|nr:C40 family peptidase [Pseudomonas sp. N040]MBF7731223.1 C40 family peptidase [Pseudomonas sp. N040]MBW7014866.1 C40 family peptidase [Pseudomonas sp. N040]
MLKRSAPLVPLLFSFLLAACAGPSLHQPVARYTPVPAPEPTTQHVDALVDDQPYELPGLADTVLERGFELVGTPYRYGGSSTKTGFDCSGFIGYLFREEAGISLPRSTREMIKLDAPLVARSELEPGDIIFFNNRGRGRVSHAGIYIGDNQFIHSASRHSGGVRVDSLADRYWRASYLEAKRVLAQKPVEGAFPRHR